MTTYSTTDVSERLSTPVSTVKLWADRLRVGNRNSQGQRRFDDADVALLEVVRSLRDSDCGFETITRQIASTPVVDQQPIVNDRQREASGIDIPPADTRQVPNLDALVERITATVTAAVTSTIKADTDQAEKYARAAHRVGQLEEQVRTLQAENGRLRSILALPLWQYVVKGRRLLAEAVGGTALPAGGQELT